MNRNVPLLRSLASMWFAAVILVLLLVAMACATVYEATHGTELALRTFYKSWWFELLLALMAANVLAAMLVRFPFSRKQIGFVLTHLSILIVLGGALVTKHFGIDGQLVILEGQTAREFTISSQPTLLIRSRTDLAQAEIDLDPRDFTGREIIEQPVAPILTLGNLRAEVARFLPDSEWTQDVTNDDPNPRAAVQVSSGSGDPVWVFAGQTARTGNLTTAFRSFDTIETLNHELNRTEPNPSKSVGKVKVEHEGQVFEYPVEDCTEKPVPLGDTGFTVQVKRYLPDAKVGSDGDLFNDSPQPRNPFIEAEIVGPNGPEPRRSFAKFPKLGSIHGALKTEGLELTFIADPANDPQVPIEVFGGPDGALHVRFNKPSGPILSEKATIGASLESPWPGRRFTVIERYHHARWSRRLVPVLPGRENREPALLVKLSTEEHTSEMWLQKQRAYPLTVDGVGHEISFADKRLPLGFDVTLNRFRRVTYPGSAGKDRSYESHITITDAETGGELSSVISMNNPVEYGRYTLYQSGRQFLDDRKKWLSYLSVSDDPGQAIVFAGYITMLIGMVWVLFIRMQDRRRAQAILMQEGGRSDRRSTTVAGTSRTAGPARTAQEPATADLDPVCTHKD